MKRAAIAALLLLSGCASLTWQTPDGSRVTVRRLGWRANLATLTVQTPDVTLQLRGYESSPDPETAKAIATGITDGLTP